MADIHEKDIVCDMDVKDDKYMHEYEGKKYYFCSQGDLDKFKMEPDKYIHAAA